MAKRKVFLVTGFNNWGKTRIIGDAFGKRAFRRDVLHQFQSTGYSFMVMPYSNDDLKLIGYCEQYYKRLKELSAKKRSPKYIISAFCPTKEFERRKKSGPKDKNSIDIINELYGQDEVHVLLLVHKWCTHAELHVPEITDFYSGLKNVTVTAIKPRIYEARLAKLSSEIHARLP
jgi:hypothetical protein